MRRSILRIGIAILSLIVLGIIIGTIQVPILYTTENTSFTPSHENLQLKKLVSEEKTATIVPLMSEILDSTGTVTLSLKLEDFPTAARDLRLYADRMDRLSNLVIQLDLSESELENWVRQNSENYGDIATLFNETERFAELEHLEVTYRNENKSHLLYTVAYEGEAIRTKVAELTRKYVGQSEVVAEENRKFELTSSSYEKSVTDVLELAQHVDGRQQERDATIGQILPLPSSNLTLSITPLESTYGDELAFNGTLSGPRRAGEDIALSIDSMPWATVETNDTGVFSYSIKVGRIRAGVHLAYAQVDETYSAIVPFTILSSESSLTLSAASNASGHVLCYGTLLSQQIPVVHAPVQISSDGRTVQSTKTDGNGSYRIGFILPDGVHRLRAVFTSKEYPLNASESDPVTITISRTDTSVTDQFPILPVLLYGGSLGICAIAARWYLIRHKVRSTIAEGELVQGMYAPPTPLNEMIPSTGDGAKAVPVLRSKIAQEVEDITQRFHAFLDEGHPSDGIHILFQWIREQVARQGGLGNSSSLTARELVHAAQALPSAGALATFVSLYEPVRYGGRVPSHDEQSRLIELVRVVVGTMEGGHH